MKRVKGSVRNGFTLIEVLVTVVVIGVLAAVVIPAVTSQVTAGDSSRVINDLNNVRTGIENFDIAVRQFPGDVDDLVNKPGTSTSSGQQDDLDINQTAFVGTANWAGPYIEASLPAGATSSTANPSIAAINTGYAATINNKFLTCSITDTGTPCNATGADYAVIEIDNLTPAQAGTLNEQIDGVGESLSSTAGKFRVLTSGTTTAYYFATPIK